MQHKIYLVSEPLVNIDEFYRFIYKDLAIQPNRFRPTANSNAEILIEMMGRLCYRSFSEEANANLTRVRKDSSEYLQNIIQQGHGSVLEHAYFSFIFSGVSRVFTHELVRHRVGVAISQESLRYVRISFTEENCYIPIAIRENEEALDLYISAVKNMYENYKKIEGLFDFSKMSFSEKKKITSALRRLLPEGHLTTIGWTANIRTLRHVIELRTSVHAEEEIRNVFRDVYYVMRQKCPNLFFDAIENEEGEIKFRFRT